MAQASGREEINRLIDEAEATIDALHDDLLAFARALLGPDGEQVFSSSIAQQESDLRARMPARSRRPAQWTVRGAGHDEETRKGAVG